MRWICPRVIRGNRGDLLSRYGILSALSKADQRTLVVCCDKAEDIQGLNYNIVPCGRLYNFFPSRAGLSALWRAQGVLWTAGLDLQDDSSLIKLLYLYLIFLSYRLIGLKIYLVAQGAGPLQTRWGRFMTRRILKLCQQVLVRDLGSYHLLADLCSNPKLVLGYDGIFLGDFDLGPIAATEQAQIDKLSAKQNTQSLIGLNIRQWFHFSSHLLPYQWAKKSYAHRSQAAMQTFLTATTELIALLRTQTNAKILLISAYEPMTDWWEDDLPWLAKIKQNFADDEAVVLVEQPLSLLGYCQLMARLDLAIGTRLHFALAALRFGVPAINISYTLKGKDIFTDLGFEEQVVTIEDFIKQPALVFKKATETLSDKQAKQWVAQVIHTVVQKNEMLLKQVLLG